jgi:hypothetical protein
MTHHIYTSENAVNNLTKIYTSLYLVFKHNNWSALKIKHRFPVKSPNSKVTIETDRTVLLKMDDNI